ncbi:hypothetical protein BASA50_000410 [Batrachochytrium salamandrivorans]|uniref:Ribosomal protein n=1 Tax=Batrachochytrium salamandrivorans TaxID=1357716 RepID=A0ABQ8ETN7_9FUNG|nr:hypothetical protein BASA62_001617 [Batrachochytrium salamandrivorans]KAH6581979.1 hypothetical protein BASA61_008726 [Batrachochytrium salamandrivorans]KAH6586455.1 hypothetical protein BASA50_000410 [Batrachochytrium salamandrivorans]
MFWPKTCSQVRAATAATAAVIKNNSLAASTLLRARPATQLLPIFSSIGASSIHTSSTLSSTPTQATAGHSGSCLCCRPTSALSTPQASLQQSSTRSYKVKTALKKRCEHCYFVVRKGKLRVLCPENGKHKQRQP